MRLNLIASIYHWRAVSSTHFVEYGRKFVVNLNVKFMNHCTLDFIASLYSVLRISIPFFFFANIYEQAVSGLFFRSGWSFFGSLMKYGFMIISFLCIAAI